MNVAVTHIVICAFGMVSKMLGKEIGGVGNRMTNRDLLNYGIMKIDQNTEKIHGEMRYKELKGKIKYERYNKFYNVKEFRGNKIWYGENDTRAKFSV